MEKLDIEHFDGLDRLDLIAREVVEGFITGLHKSPYHGFSVEFAEHRLYNTGEAIKHIDWKLFAKTDKLFVKRFEEETNLRAQILIDTSSSMRYPIGSKRLSKLHYAAWSAAALVHLMRKQRDGVGITLYANDIELHTPAKLSEAHLKRLYAELDKMLATTGHSNPKQSGSAQVFHQVSEQLHPRSLVIILSDLNEWFAQGRADEFFSALQHFKYNKHEVVVFALIDPATEIDLQFSNQPTRFVDLETREELRLNPLQVRQHYQQRAQDYYNDIRLTCAHYEIDYVHTNIRDDIRDVLAQYLIKREKMF